MVAFRAHGCTICCHLDFRGGPICMRRWSRGWHVCVSHALCVASRSTCVLLDGRRLSKSVCCRLWAHEALRIFHDRLVNDDDRRWFGNYLKAAVEEHLHLQFDEVFAAPNSAAGAEKLDVLSATRSLLYCNFLTQVRLECSGDVSCAAMNHRACIQPTAHVC